MILLARRVRERRVRVARVISDIAGGPAQRTLLRETELEGKEKAALDLLQRGATRFGEQSNAASPVRAWLRRQRTYQDGEACVPYFLLAKTAFQQPFTIPPGRQPIPATLGETKPSR